MQHRLTAPYYPLSNGAVERANRTVKSMLRAFMKQHNTREWVRALQFVTFAANTSRHRTTGMTPFLLHRGREPHAAARRPRRLTAPRGHQRGSLSRRPQRTGTASIL